MDDTFVTVEAGRLGGVASADGAVRAFLGVPYAAPPVGDLRWRPPQPVRGWTGVREARAYGPASRQPPIPRASLYYGHETAFDEDCLYLNVWTGGAGAPGGRPVMVWLHPGAYQFGSGQNPLYDGTALARDGVTLVTLNHRLGRFGFLAHPLLSAESGYGGSGNYGLMDVLEALRWVQRNIEAFGGDPGNVTLFGVSAGGNTVHNLRASPLAGGLIHRSIAQSGPGVGPVLAGHGHALGPSTLAAAEQAGEELTDLIGVTRLSALRALPAEAVEQVVMPRAAGDWRFKLIPGAEVSTHVFDAAYPVIDGHVMPQSPLSAYRRGEQLDIPLMSGSAGNEASGLPYLPTLAAYERFVRAEFGAYADEALACYPAADDAEAHAASWAMEADRTFVWSSLTAARMQAATGSAPAWHYRFDRAPVIPASDDVIERDYAGAFHTAEVPYVFGTLDVRAWPWTAEDRVLARAMAGAWTAFARTGDPNRGDRPAWPRYEDGKDTTMVWDVEPHVGRPVHPERLAFLDRFNAVWDGSAASVARREDRTTVLT